MWCLDACELGEGIFVKYESSETVHAIGGYSERLLFRDGEAPARVAAHARILECLIDEQDKGGRNDYLKLLDKRREGMSRCPLKVLKALS